MRRTEGYSDHLRPKIVQIGPVVQALEQFSRMQSEPEQTLVRIVSREKNKTSHQLG